MAIEQEKIDEISKRYKLLQPFMDEQQSRLWAGAEAHALGHGGLRAVAKATGFSHTKISRGRDEVSGVVEVASAEMIRRPGAGRPRTEETQPELVDALLALVEPTTRGDPESPLRWTCKSVRNLTKELNSQGFSIGRNKVHQLLMERDFSLQAPRKMEEGKDHPDRDEQFRYINQTVIDFHQNGQPVVSIDTKKKELVGEFYQKGQEWQPKGQPEKVNTYDFPNLAIGRAVPYGIYDIFAQEGWVSVGVSADTAAFAVNSIRTWWYEMGIYRYPDAHELLLTADGGGSNGHRLRLWKKELQDLADETGLTIHVLHYPPGTSKWNKIEHQMFSYISKNWRGRPLTSYEVVVNCIAATTNEKGLEISAALDKNIYEKGIKISDEVMDSLQIERDEFHGDWNYAIIPRQKE